jgi:acyl-CoA thioesterase FadM
LTEIAVDWSSDQDPNNHVSNPSYPRYALAGNVRLFESFAGLMGDKYADMLSGKGIGPMLKRYTVDLKRPTAYPDAVRLFTSRSL